MFVHVFGPGPPAPAVSAITCDTTKVVAAIATTVRTPTCIRLINAPLSHEEGECSLPRTRMAPKVCRSIVGSVPRDHRVSKKFFGQKRCAEHFCGAWGYSDQSFRGVSDPSLSNVYIWHEYRGVATE